MLCSLRLSLSDDGVVSDREQSNSLTQLERVSVKAKRDEVGKKALLSSSSIYIYSKNA